MERTDEMIKKDVVDQLFWDDRIDASCTEGVISVRNKLSSSV